MTTEPVRCENGFGMNVASVPCSRQRVHHVAEKVARSAVVRRSAYCEFDSNWQFASS